MKRILLVAFILSGLVAAYFIRSCLQSGQRLNIALASIPEKPSLEGKPAIFVERFTEAENTASNHPDYLESLSQLSRLYHVNGYYDEAIQCYNGLILLDDSNGIWPHRLASIYSKFGQLGEAMDYLEQTISLAPDYMPAWVRLGNAYFKLNGSEKAGAAYTEALELAPNDPHALFGMARVRAIQEDWSEVQALLEKARKASNVNVGIDLLVTAYEEQGNLSKANQVRGEAKSLSGHNEMPDPWISELFDDCFDDYQLALAAGAEERNGAFDVAVRRLKQAIRLAPENSQHHTQLGKLYRTLKQPEEAIISLSEATKVNPKDPDAWAYLVTIQKELGQDARAEALLETGLQYCPRSYDLLMEKGRLLSRRGLYASSSEHFLSAAEVRFDSAQPLVEAASNAFKTEQVSDGIELLQRALKAEPDHPLALSTLAYAAIATSNKTLADQVLARIENQARISPKDKDLIIQNYKDTFGVAWRN